jgi:xanthine dehydrogenase accessory factor
LDFAVTVFDDRPALANHQFFPETVALRTGDWAQGEKEPWPATPTFGLIVTRGHRHDAVVLRSWIKRPFAFLGMIGSARKARTIREHFLQENLATVEQLARVACPVGLDIGGQSVKEIAVSILSQYILKRAEVLHETLGPNGIDDVGRRGDHPGDGTTPGSIDRVALV